LNDWKKLRRRKVLGNSTKSLEARIGSLETRFGIAFREPKVFITPDGVDWPNLPEDEKRRHLVAAGIDPDRDRVIRVVYVPSNYNEDGSKKDVPEEDLWKTGKHKHR
jgi:hypothetical protein